MPENWPGGKAPVRWTYDDASDRRAAARAAYEQRAADGIKPNLNDEGFIYDSMGVECWVPEYAIAPDGGGQIWWSSFGVPSGAVTTIRQWIRLEAELCAELDPIIDRHNELAYFHADSGLMAVPG